MRKIKSLPVSQSVQSGEMSITGMGDMITGCRALYAKVTPSNSSYVNVRAKEGGKGVNRLRLYLQLFTIHQNFPEKPVGK